MFPLRSQSYRFPQVCGLVEQNNPFGPFPSLLGKVGMGFSFLRGKLT